MQQRSSITVKISGMPNNPEKISDNSYIFIDESGKPEVYSARGKNLVELNQASRHLVLAAIRHQDQLQLQSQITDFRAELLRDDQLTQIFSPAYTLDSFHAQVDYPEVRKRFYEFINTLDIKIDVIVVEKLKCYPALQRKPGQLYAVMAGQLLKNLGHHASNTHIVFSRKDSKLKLQEELQNKVESIRVEYLSQHPDLDKSFDLKYFHNPHYSHGGLQVADYIAYAVYQVYERDNREWYEMICAKVGKIHDICNKKYFTRSNPL